MTVPFDILAQEYDQTFTQSAIGKIQRNQVWSYLDKILPELTGREILELTCGTGEDAIQFAQRGFNVLATDSSKQMLQVAENKIRRHSLASTIRTQLIDLETLNEINFDQKFDLIFSNFGGLNCISPEKFKSILSNMQALLNKNGRIVIVLINEFCLWETVYYSLKFDLQKAFRRINSKPATVNFNGMRFSIWYHFSNIYNNHPHTKKIQSKAIAVFTPPSYLEFFFNRHKGFLKLLEQIDNYATRFSWSNHLSDHILLEFQPK